MAPPQPVGNGDAPAPPLASAPTAASPTPAMTLPSPDTKHILRAKRPARERQKKARFELLHAMTAEERRRFLQEEEIAKQQALNKLQRAAAVDSKSQRVAVDLSFDSIMNDKELRSLAKQLKLSYGSVKQMNEPFQLLLCNPSEQLETFLERFGAVNWHVQWRRAGDGMTDYFPSSELVYLSPDSPNVLEEMDPNKVYVIGGIVDKTRKKGATLNAATEAGITTARLPIQEHITERLDHILNVNTVIDVLINFAEFGDWPRALEAALPQRKRSQVGRKALRRRQKQQQTGETPRRKTSWSGSTATEVSVSESESPLEDMGVLMEELTG